MSLPPERRRQLQELGLRALVKRRFGAAATDAARGVAYSGGAAVVTAPGDGPLLAAVFADVPAGLGSAIDVASREGCGHLYFFSELNSPDVARRAAEFRVAVTVVSPDGDFEPLEAAPPPSASPVPEALGDASRRMLAAGLDVMWEHGVLTGEWLGLEVSRATPDGRFDVGVGKHDREANRELYPLGPPDQFLDQAVATVRELRRPGAPSHPANQLAPERWLRTLLVGHPDIVGLDHLEPAPPPERREDLRQRSVAPAWAPDGTVVVCSAGIDPDFVPQAADARVQAPGWPGYPPATRPRLVLVVPAGDDHPMTRRLAALLRDPADVITVPAGWRAALP